MHYHVSRGGQTYGPYTLADLQRYVASGHILLNDLAKSEEMSDWIPVGQILNTPPAADAKRYFKYDTAVVGNANTGHNYPWTYGDPSRSETDLRDLLEYLKTL